MKKLADVLLVLGVLGLVGSMLVRFIPINTAAWVGSFTAWKFGLGCLLLSIALSVRQR